MSVGLSQVNFDAQALEDEEEAALEKEDEEREKEIRDLLTNELDDDLLDDDNASFSSHDFRSSTNGAGTPYSDISPRSQVPHQQNGQFDQDEFADFHELPHQRGAFERLPLITPRGLHLIQQPNNRAQVPHGATEEYSGYTEGLFNPTDGDQQRREHPGAIYQHDKNNNHKEISKTGHNQPQSQSSKDFTGGDFSSYKTSSSGEDYHSSHHAPYQDNFYSPHSQEAGTVEPNTYYHEHSEAAYEGYHHWTGPGMSDYGQGIDVDARSTGYQQGGMNAETLRGNVSSGQHHDQDPSQGGNREQHHLNSNNSFPGQYTVHYKGRESQEGGNEPQYQQDTVRRTDGDGDHPITTTDVTQLQILYKARGRKLEELTQKLNEQEEDLSQQIRVLNHQLLLMKDERDGMAVSLEQSQKLVQQLSGDINSMKVELSGASQEVQALRKGKEEAESKLHMAEETVGSLNHQLVEMSRSESLRRTREQHESILSTARKRHEEEQLRLKQKFDDTVLSLNWKTEEANRLKDELLEKSQMINSLTKNLDDSQKQCQELLTTGTMSEINDLRRQLEESTAVKLSMQEECDSLKREAQDLQEQLASYETATRLGLSGSSNARPGSHAYFGVRNLNKEDWATPRSSKAPLEETVSELRAELEHCLVSNQEKRERVKQLEAALKQTNTSLEEHKKRAERADQIATEHEARAQAAMTKVQQLEQERREPDEQHQELLRELDATKKHLQTLQDDFVKLEGAKEDLSELNMDLKQQMAQMVAEFDEDKSTSLEKCRNSCLQLHEDAQTRLRQELEEVHRQEIMDAKRELDRMNDELLRVKECYLQLTEESRGLEARLREEFEHEKQALVEQAETKTDNADPSSGEGQTAAEESERWGAHMKRTILEETERLRKQFDDEKEGAIRSALAVACVEWEEKRKMELEEKIAETRKEWLQQQEPEFQKRLSNAIAEARKIWGEEERLKKETERKKSHDAQQHESRDREVSRAVELALSQAHADWLKNEEEIRQREIEQAVEVAITNAVAEARAQWEKEQENLENGVVIRRLIQEKARWSRDQEAERAKAVEAAVAIAEVQWLEREQKRVTTAVDEALETVRETWTAEKEQDIVRAVEEARRQWCSGQDGRSADALESAAREQLVSEFERQKEQAVQEAVRQTREECEESNLNRDIDSLREEIVREFEEQKEAEFQESLEEARATWLEEFEEEKQAEVNEAIAYLEAQYKRGLEEFKHKELREALAKAREQWVQEEEAEREESHKARLAVAHIEWQKTQQQAIRGEIDRALESAREAWVAEHQGVAGERVRDEVQKALDALRTETDAEKHRAVQQAVDEVRRKADSEKKLLEKEFERRLSTRSHEDARSKWEEEVAALESEYQQQLAQLNGEFESRLRQEQEQGEQEARQTLAEARRQWDDHQQQERAQLEKQHQDNVKLALEKLKDQQQKEREAAVKAAFEQATRKQQDMQSKERQAHQKEVERLKEEISSLYREGENREKTQRREKSRERWHDNNKDGFVFQDSDTSLSGVDQASMKRGLRELREHYLDSVAKIQHDVMEHVTQTKANAAKKIRSEVLRERHSTAKKLRRHYLQCLKQMLEEDRVALEASTPLVSNEVKVERMKRALDTVSPDKDNSGQPSQQPNTPAAAPEAVRTPVTGDVTPSMARDPDRHKAHGRPRGYGPEGESDPQRAVRQPETDFTRKLREFKARKHAPAVTCTPSSGSTPKRASERVLPPGTENCSEHAHGQQQQPLSSPYRGPAGSKTQENALKNPALVSDNGSVQSCENGDLGHRQRTTHTEHVYSYKPVPSQNRTAYSPALSVTSCESEQYSDLPTVIRVSPECEDVTSTERIPAKRTPTSNKPVLKKVPAPHVDSRVGRLAREMPLKGSPTLPSKPRIGAAKRHTSAA